MAVTPRRLKSRELILTTHRLLCLKRKPGRAVQVRTELFMTPSSEKEKDGRHIISGVEPKGEREFVVITVRLPHAPFYQRFWGASARGPFHRKMTC